DGRLGAAVHGRPTTRGPEARRERRDPARPGPRGGFRVPCDQLVGRLLAQGRSPGPSRAATPSRNTGPLLLRPGRQGLRLPRAAAWAGGGRIPPWRTPGRQPLRVGRRLGA